MMEYAKEKNFTDEVITTIVDNATAVPTEVIRQKLLAINRKEVIKRAPILAIYVFIMSVGLIENCFVFYIYKVKFKQANARTYILYLALLDFLVCCVGIPYHTLDLTHIVTYYQAEVCRALSYFIGVVNIGSVFVLMVVAVDRYLKVCRPLKRQVVDFGDRKACAIAILSAIIISIPNAILYGKSSVEENADGLTFKGVECFLDDKYGTSTFAVVYIVLYILLFLICVITLIVLYTLIYRKIHKSQTFKTEQTVHHCGRCCFSISAIREECDTESDYNGKEENTMDSTNKFGFVSEGDRIKDKHMDIILEKQLNVSEVKTDKATSVNDSVIDADNGALAESLIMRSDIVKPQESRITKFSASDIRIIRNQAAKEIQHEGVKQIKAIALVRHTIEGTGEKHTRKITLMMLTITVLFILSYLPYVIIMFLSAVDSTYWDNMSSSMELFTDFMMRFYVFNSVANAIIYSFWDERFRRECLFILKAIFLCC